MPKSQYVDPGKAFEAGYIHFEDIPVCQYNKTLAQEKKIYTMMPSATVTIIAADCRPMAVFAADSTEIRDEESLSHRGRKAAAFSASPGSIHRNTRSAT